MKYIIVLFTVLSFTQGGFAQQKQPAKELKEAKYVYVVGDWGRFGNAEQKAVAASMTSIAKQQEAEAIISVGDNFYPSGVASTVDPQWNKSFEDIYTDYALQSEWWVALGNHDYKGNVDAQLQYCKISRRWRMPARYFTQILALENNQSALFIFLDTNPFIKKYYQENSYKAEVGAQDTLAQKHWLDSVLQVTKGKFAWRIIVGHHPLYSGGKRLNSADTKDMYTSFHSVLQAHAIDLYLAGHEHHLEHTHLPTDKTHHLISGSGSETRPTQKHPTGGLFGEAKPGFVQLAITKDVLQWTFFDDQQKILHQYSLTR